MHSMNYAKPEREEKCCFIYLIYIHKRGQNIILSIIIVSKRQEQYSAFLIFNTEISEIIWVDNILLVFTLMLSKIKLILIHSID